MMNVQYSNKMYYYLIIMEANLSILIFKDQANPAPTVSVIASPILRRVVVNVLTDLLSQHFCANWDDLILRENNT